VRLSGNTILVTGGGSGIGRELAREFHQLGNRVIVAGRRLGPLEALAKAHPGMTAVELDVADAQAVSKTAARLLTDHPDLNVLVNNAGIMVVEDKIDLPVAEATVATNLLGPIRLTAALLPHLLGQLQGTIVNVSSALGFVPLVYTPTYCATKAAIHSWSISLREQLRGTSVEVVEVIPPGVQTELQPGLSSNPRAMPLDAFMAETMAQFRTQPTPPEICGEWAQAMRNVVDAQAFGQVMQAINQ
jgi:uncharacterized oxidoreductase